MACTGRHRLLQVHRGDGKEAGQIRERTTYKKTEFFKVTCGLFGILSLGMGLALASDCLCPAPLHPSIPWLGSDTHLSVMGAWWHRATALAVEQRQTVPFSFSLLRLQHVELLPLKPPCSSSSSVLSKSLHPFTLLLWLSCELLWARLLLRSFLASGEDPMHCAASWPCTSSLPCFAPQSPSSAETSACGGKELEEVSFSGMSSLLPLPGIYTIFTCPNSQHHQKLSLHTRHKGFRDLCHAQGRGGPCPQHSSFLWPVDPLRVPCPICYFYGDKSC